MNHLYPVAETFLSPQGEGLYTGTLMYFIRLAGCNVGSWVEPPESIGLTPELRVLNSQHSICTTLTGEKFLCDTDYDVRWHYTLEQLLALVTPTNVKHICLTGGEPFLHNVASIVDIFWSHGITTHIETSGTKPISDLRNCWITCSPKAGFLKLNRDSSWVNEWKFLIGDKFNSIDEASIVAFAKQDNYHRDIYIQPIGDINTHLQANVEKCIHLQRSHPSWKLSAQLHKYINVR